MSDAKLLLVNADDFGFTRDVNDGILDAHHQGIVTSATLMACGPAFAHAAELARENPTLDVGCHLVLTGGVSLLEPQRPLPPSVSALLRAVAFRRLSPYEELRAQVCKILDARITPTHLDTHKHTHAFPPVAEAVGRIAEEFHIRWVRRPLDFPVLRTYLEQTLARHGCRMTDRFAGFRLTGRLDVAALIGVIRSLAPGTTELMCHPGYLRGELRAAGTRLKETRERELQALTAPQVRQALRDAAVTLTTFRSLVA